jgi:hypothetical protein
VGDFVLEGVSIVNGAQTVSAIARAAKARGTDQPLACPDAADVIELWKSAKPKEMTWVLAHR